MNHFQQQTHVAQQSRREKLRIPGSLHHPSSPQSGNHSDHSAGSASAVLEARPDQGGSAVYANEVLPSVYGQNVEAYNFTGASELLAYAGKPNGFMGSSGSDILQAGFSNPATVIPKNSNWHGINGQLGHYSGSSNTPLGSSSTLLSTLQGRDGGGGSSMGTYNLSGTNTQAEAMQLYLSGYSGYSDPSSTPMVLISPGTNSTAGAQTGGLIGIPLSQPGQQDGGAPNGLQTESFAAPRGTYNNWRNVGDEFLFLPSSEATQQRKSITNEVSGGLNQMTDEYGRSLSTILGQQQNAQSLLQAGHRLEIDNSQQATAGQHAFQSLSLSLSNQNVNAQLLDTGITSPDTKRAGQKLSDLSHFRTSPTGYANKHVYFDAAGGASLSAVSNSFSFVSGSRYLRAAQQLLDEVCSVGRGIKPALKKLGNQSQSSPAAVTSSMHKDGGMAGDNSVKSEITMGSSVAVGASSPGTGPTAVSSVAPSTAAATAESKESITVLTPEERQENEGKKTKLLAMLQEVDRRYRQYYDQMQVVITSFDAVAGAGAATPYTALALQAMSRYFRCLRDAITGQIQSTCKALGEEDVSKSITSRPLTSRLRFIDQQIRQQRAYQQYGMLQQHAWRPQRGLPERSVSILRAWLFEHFLHPYPKDADKMMLARQTGLTRGQVSNWFINARVRLWKPMVEEMYQEEIKEQEMGAISAARLNQEGDHSKHSHDGGDTMVVIDKMQMEHTAATDQQNYSSDYGMLSTMRKADFGDSSSQLKKSRLALQDSVGLLAEAGMEVDMKSAAGNMNSYAQDTYSGVPIQESFGDRRYGTFTGLQFNPNAGVSLTLGLRNCDNLQQQIAAAAGQQSFLAGGHNFMGTRTHIQGPHDGGDLCNLYENAAGSGIAAGHIAHEGGIDYQGRKQQHMESHLLHDFVA